MLSDASPPHPPPPNPTPSPNSSQCLPPPQDVTHFISFKGKNTYIYLIEETEDLGISSKVSTLKTATTEMKKVKETPPPF